MGILSAMPDERVDPSQNTQAFQAWVDNNNQAAQPAATGSKLGFIVAGAVVAVVLVVVVVLLVV
ncbi:hypothetical protein GCM10027610_132390 [Dactylosporangium cerinum]